MDRTACASSWATRFGGAKYRPSVIFQSIQRLSAALEIIKITVMRDWRFAIALTLFGVLAVTAFGHPHMWIDGSFEFEFGDRGLQRIHVRWRFDDFNSADLRAQFDENDDGLITGAEQTAIYEGAFKNLDEVDYFILSNVGGQAYDLPDATDFRASVDDGKLVYEFTIPLEMRFSRFNNMVLAFFDASYFIDFVTEPASENYFKAGRTIEIQEQQLSLQTRGWGTIPIVAIRAVVL